MATQHDFAEHIGVSQQTVAALIRDGKIPRGNGRSGLDIDECRLAYVAHLREVAAGRLGDSDGALDLVAERARLAKAQADQIEMRNDLTRGRVVQIDVAISMVAPLLLGVRNRFLGLPSKMAPALAKMTDPRSVYVALEAEIHEILTALQHDPIAAARAKSMTNPDAVEAIVASADPEPAPHKPRRAGKPTKRN